MKKLCKNIKLNADFIEQAIYLCLTHKWERSDVIRYLAKHSDRTEAEIRSLVKCTYIEGEGFVHQRYELAPEVRKIAEKLADEIKERRVTFPAIKKRERYDSSSRKLRELGIESIKQQFYDYVAVEGLKELLDKKIGDNQFACLPGRGQEYGVKRLETWIDKYPGRCKYVGKGDIKKCYPSIPTESLIRYLRKWVDNDDLLYLTELLIGSYGGGLSIGSYLSTWLCNLYLSRAYHYASEKLYKIRHKKDGSTERKRLLFKVSFYMDDIVIFGPRKADIKIAMEKINEYLQKELGLRLKNDWRVFELKGNFVDFMGYKIGFESTTIRSRTFLKIRRTYKKADRQIRESGSVRLCTARRVISLNGKIQHSDSNKFQSKYHAAKVLKESKRRVSYESKIHRQTASS